MKFTWEESDVVPGVRVGKRDRAEQYIIGYLNGSAKGSNFCLVSLEDGMVTNVGTAAALADSLNSNREEPVETLKMPRRGKR